MYFVILDKNLIIGEDDVISKLKITIQFNTTS